MYVYIRVHTTTHKCVLCYTETHYCQVLRARAYPSLDSLSMDGAELAIYCMRSARSCATCWCPDSELADAHRGECAYRRMAEVMEELDAARDQLLDDDDGLIGLVKDVKAVEKLLRHRLLPHNAWLLVPFFELFLSAPKDELHQWYLGLFGDHIVPALFYCYTQILQRPDLVNSIWEPLVITARLEAVWKKLSDRFTSVVADTSMITLTTAYAAHFHDIYIDGKENAKMTGDSMKMLKLTLPFMFHDLIAPEVHSSLYILVYTLYI